MRLRTTLLMVVVAALAVAGVALWERELPGTDERRERQALLLSGIEAAEVEEIAIERPSARVRLNRRDGRWWITEPLEDRAEASRVDSLLRTVLGTRALARVSADEVSGGEEATGLGADASRVTISAGGDERGLVVGSRPAPGGARFVRVDGEPGLALVRESLVDAIGVKPASLRDPSLLGVSARDVERIEVRRAGDEWLTAERAAESHGFAGWKLIRPFEDEADGERMDALADEIARLKIDPAASPASEELSPESAEWTIAVTASSSPGGGEPVRERVELLIGGEDGSQEGLRAVSVSGRPGAHRVEAGELESSLIAGPGTLRSLSLIDVPSYDVAAVTVSRGEVELEAERVEGVFEPESQWRAVAPEGFDLDSAGLDRAVRDLSLIDATGVAADASAAEAGLEPPVAIMKFRLDGDAPEVSLEVGREAAGGGGVYARRSGRATVLLLDESTAARIDPEAYRSDRSGNESVGQQ
jgi:hypothetical protein